MYKLTQSSSVIRMLDGACIPADPANSDYREYQSWLEEGNTPEPADSPTKSERIAAVNAEYAISLAVYDKAWTSANRAGGASLANKLAAIQADAAALKIQRDADIAVIRNS